VTQFLSTLGAFHFILKKEEQYPSDYVLADENRWMGILVTSLVLKNAFTHSARRVGGGWQKNQEYPCEVLSTSRWSLHRYVNKHVSVAPVELGQRTSAGCPELTKRCELCTAVI